MCVCVCVYVCVCVCVREQIDSSKVVSAMVRKNVSCGGMGVRADGTTGTDIYIYIYIYIYKHSIYSCTGTKRWYVSAATVPDAVIPAHLLRNGVPVVVLIGLEL